MAVLNYDHIVVGSGITGMTISLLLGLAGRKVLLLEKGADIGGSMRRFRRNGIPFDTGFHFTAGPSGCFGDMLKVLGLDSLEAIPIQVELVLSDLGKRFLLRHDRNTVCADLCKHYPQDQEKIRKYFDLEKHVYETTPLFHLRECSFSKFNYTPEDFITLKEWMDQLGISPEVRAILCSMTSCHGTPVGEMPLSGHMRVSYGLFDDLVRIKGGGEPFITGFLEEAGKYGIDIRTNCTIAECLDATRHSCRKVRLTDGDEIHFNELVMTTHPRAAADLLPESLLNEDFKMRLDSAKDSCGFFSVFFEITPMLDDFQEKLISRFSTVHVDELVNPAFPGSTATGMMFTREADLTGKIHQTVTCFESVFPEETARWNATRRGKRGPGYAAYKQRKVSEIRQQLLECAPELEGHLQVMDSASMLTFRDYLSPIGSAYGFRKQVGQQDFFGRLPIRNFYICGQSSMLPGAMGCMLSAFIIWRHLIGDTQYLSLLNGRLGSEV